jgi:mono/diheme cytochrome c family protein
MRGKAVIYLLVLGLLFCLLSACGGGGGGYTATPAPQVSAPPPPAAPAPGYAMGPGMRHNFGMMYDNMGQMYGMMGRGYMRPEHYDYMRGMMGQMGGMMQGMSGPSYNRQMEQQHRQQLEQMNQNLAAMEKQGRARGAASASAIFASNCASCHPNGGNIVNPNFPIRGASQLGSYSSFRSVVRQGPGAMPSFPSSSISDAELQELYRYVVSAYGR